MATVIQSDSIDRHAVDKYNFKVIAFGGNSTDSRDEADEKKYTPEDNPKQRATDIDASALDTKSKDSLIESLMKKTDDMSSNFIKLQMKLEAKEEEFKNQLQAAKEESFSEGMKAAKAEALAEIDKELNNKLELYKSSIAKLEQSSKEFESSMEAVKKELVSAALDIAKEVIKVELDQNSSQVAKILSDELIKDLQGASQITLKVNPKDHTYISEHLGKLEHISVVADNAVSQGGVIVVSDAGNIDAQISKRFERVKKAALSD